MNIILGFGKCEEDVRNKVMDIVNKSSGTWNELQQIAKDWNAPNETYDKMSKETSPPELRFDINNGETLCKKCHAKRPKGKEIFLLGRTDI